MAYQTATIHLWGHQVGAVSWLDDRGYAAFEYDPSFLKRGLDISPLHMGISSSEGQIHTFPALNRMSFMGLPGLLADVLPDKFGNAIIDAWLTRQGRDAKSFGPVERLCYIGARGMGALEFAPAENHKLNKAVQVEVAELVSLAQEIITAKQQLDVTFSSDDSTNAEAMMDILRVGTSAGGARPKAIIAMNPEGKILSGQTDVPEDYEHWLLKFDGVSDLELGKPGGYGRIEYAYHLMAVAAGIEMTECRLLEENGRAHFMTKRFDRHKGQKKHMQSLCGLAHYDFNMAGAHSYEQAFSVMRKLRLSKAEAVQQFKRAVFNILSRNQDDHTKNIAFLMGQDGQWKLSPAYDVTYSHNPAGKWTNMHQMSINGKRDSFTLEDLAAVGKSISIAKPTEIVKEIAEVVAAWPQFAGEANMDISTVADIAKHHRVLE